MKQWLIALVVGFATFAGSVHALWYEGEGQAQIIDGNVDAARQQALQDALLGIMHRGGASVRSVQVVREGVLETDLLTVRTNGEVHNMRLLTEQIQGDIIQVTVSADIFPTQGCFDEDYSKTLFVGPTTLMEPVHGQLGGVYSLGKVFSGRLYQHLRRHNGKLDARHVMIEPIDRLSMRLPNQHSDAITVAQSLSEQYDVQYLVFGVITDLSDYRQHSYNLIGVKESTLMRNFSLTMQVVDGVLGEVVSEHNYDFQQEWPFDAFLKIDVTGETFWGSEFGTLVESVIRKAARDIEGELHCRTTYAKVVAFHDGQAVINLGSRNGVKKGDRFRLMRSIEPLYQSGWQQGVLFRPDDVFLQVTAVQGDKALLSSDDAIEMSNIQLRDVMVAVNEMDISNEKNEFY